MDLYQLHPNLRALPESWLAPRMSWYSFWYPAEQRIFWFGDCMLYCRDQDYQHVLDNVPCLTRPDDNGNGRVCALKGAELDAWREQVRRWLDCFNEVGKQVHVWKPAEAPKVEPAAPVESKRAPWFGRGLSQYLRRGKPE